LTLTSSQAKPNNSDDIFLRYKPQRHLPDASTFTYVDVTPWIAVMVAANIVVAIIIIILFLFTVVAAFVIWRWKSSMERISKVTDTESGETSTEG